MLQLMMDEGKLIVSHAGLKSEFIGKDSPTIRSFCMFGQTTGKRDQYGLPVRYPWAEDYQGAAMIVYGHTPVAKAEWLNNTVNIDTGCVFGGQLTALRYPEKQFVSEAAARVYYALPKPLE